MTAARSPPRSEPANSPDLLPSAITHSAARSNDARCCLILRDEPEAEACTRALENSIVRRISTANFVEAAVIIDASRDPVAGRHFDALVLEAQIIIEPVTEAQARIAREAYRDFGKGSGHQSKLNFGDCFAYALAKVTGEPLLFKGDDFEQTDIKWAGQWSSSHLRSRS